MFYGWKEPWSNDMKFETWCWVPWTLVQTKAVLGLTWLGPNLEFIWPELNLMRTFPPKLVFFAKPLHWSKHQFTWGGPNGNWPDLKWYPINLSMVWPLIDPRKTKPSNPFVTSGLLNKCWDMLVFVMDALYWFSFSFYETLHWSSHSIALQWSYV